MAKYPTYKGRRKPDWRKRMKAHFARLRIALRKLILPAAFALAAFIIWFLLSLPAIDKLNARKSPGVLFKAADGRVIGSYGEAYGDSIPFDDLPKDLVHAVLATEDRDFFTHAGIDLSGIARAMLANFRAGHTVQGGSTVTQQLAKNIFLTPERSVLRKLREALLAFKLERRYSKEEIFSIYVNRVYFGAGAYGIDAAARRYFDKSARDLSLPESALLVGLLKAPSRYAPTGNPKAARGRAQQVLLNMADAGYLKPAEAERAIKELPGVVTRIAKASAESTRYFTDWIVDQLPDYVGAVDEDLVVTTTLTPEWQKAAEQAVKTVMDERGAKLNATQAALVAVAPDGAVRAMVGGRNYAESPFNRAAQARRQPGSAFKLFVYLAALESGFTPGSTLIDQPVSVGKWQPRNYDGEYRGEVTLKEAVAQSINTVAVQVMEAVGRGRVVEMARRLGLEGDIAPLPSLALGATETSLLELTGAYAHLAAGGQAVTPYGILKVETASGKRLYRFQPEPQAQVLSGSTVGMMNNMLMGVIHSGTGRAAAIGRPAAGKTGTTSDYRDAWFIGYTPDLAAGVWVGNDDNAMMKKVAGGTLPAPIWRAFMQAALAGTPAHELPVSSGFWQALLPWQNESAPEHPAPPEGVHIEQAPPPAAPSPQEEKPHGFRLPQQFWDKLMDEEAIDPTYPEQRPRR